MTIRDKLKRDIVRYFIWAIDNSKYLQEIRDNLEFDIKYFNDLLLTITPSDIKIHYGDIEYRIDKNLFNICKLIFNNGVNTIKYRTIYKSSFIRGMIASIYTIHNDYLTHFLHNNIDALNKGTIKDIYTIMNNDVFNNN